MCTSLPLQICSWKMLAEHKGICSFYYRKRYEDSLSVSAASRFYCSVRAAAATCSAVNVCISTIFLLPAVHQPGDGIPAWNLKGLETHFTTPQQLVVSHCFVLCFEFSFHHDRIFYTRRSRHDHAALAPFSVYLRFSNFGIYEIVAGCLMVFLNLFIPDNQQLTDQLCTSYKLYWQSWLLCSRFCVHAKGFP